MSEQTDQKLQEAVVAQYAYRHEAEFAAGFLDHAEIPYRLQIDDPAMGFSIATPATIWVRAMDLSEARELLEVSVGRIEAPRPVSVQPRGHSELVVDRILTVRERIWAAAASGGVTWMAYSYLSDSSAWLSGTAWTVAAVILLIAIVGRAPTALKGLLGALSGTAP